MASGLYLVGSHLQHNCNPNTEFNVIEGKLVLTAERDIKQKEELFIAYIPIYEEYKDRQAALAQYNFVCNCDLP